MEASAGAWIAPRLSPLAPAYKLNQAARVVSPGSGLEGDHILHTIRQCKYFLRVIYPCFYVLFVVIFWIVGFYQYYRDIQ